MNVPHLVVRAIDVGYGHVKFTDGRDTETGDLRTYSIPSQSPGYKGTIVAGGGGVMKRRDTFVIPIADRLYEVGREVHRALSGRQETEVLDENFALSDQYAARLFGAVNYMLPNLPTDVIDILVLGLPLNTYRKLHRQLADRFTDTFQITEEGDRADTSLIPVNSERIDAQLAAGLGLTLAADYANSINSGGPTNTELILTTTVTRGGQYLARKTDVYYLENADTPLFTRPSYKNVNMKVVSQ